MEPITVLYRLCILVAPAVLLLAAAFTVCSLVHRRHHLAEALLVDASALVFLMVMVVLGPFLWGASLRAERVVVWQGQTLLEEERGFPRQGVDYYDYPDRWSVERPPSCFWAFRRMGLRRRTDSNGTNRGLQNWTGSFQVFMV